MKKIVTTLWMFFIVSALLAQAPETINYQVVARDGSGNLISNQPVRFRLSIRQGSLSGTVVYCETQSMTTNPFGLATLEIGKGTVVSGSFSAISWGNDSYYLQTEMDPAGGTSYVSLGTSQFLSVPYALYSKTAGNSPPAGTTGQTLRSDGNSWIPNSTIYNNGSRVGVGTANPDNSAMLDVTSANKGFLAPRMTGAEMIAIPSPAEGLIVFCTDCSNTGSGITCIHVNGTWKLFSFSSCIPDAPVEGSHVAQKTAILWEWTTGPRTTGSKWNTTNNYATATDMGTATTKVENGLTCNTAYTRYAWAYGPCGISSPLNMHMSTTSGLTPPPAGTHVPSPFQIVWNWNTVTDATGYKWNTTNDYGSATDMGTATQKTETGLLCNTDYTRYVWAYSACGNSLPGTLTQTTISGPPATPTAGTNIPSQTQITWNWNPVPGATGYYFNYYDDYGKPMYIGTATTYTEHALTPNTPYTRYVWSYDNCGVSSSVILTQTTLP